MRGKDVCDSIMFMMSKTTKKIKLASPIDCTACAACVSVCPQKCISMVEDREGFLQPKIDTSKCIHCHRCEKTCPIINQEPIADDFETKAYAVINKDEEIRAQSSSGGVFFPLAKWVIEQGGVVFGARWNEKWEVVHDYAEDIEGVKRFMRSKYVQSVVGGTLNEAKTFLDQGRWVLYSGTPCQLGGLRAYLGKDYEKLIQVDLICHGVPSPGVWRKYLKESFGGEKILDINFRDKCDGWLTKPCVSIVTNEYKQRVHQMDNLFFKGFSLRLINRKSCYTCKFRSYIRHTDITLADFWGVDTILPSFYDDRGSSIVFMHTKKGGNLFVLNTYGLKILPQEKVDAIRVNQGMVQNSSKPKNRGICFLLFIFFGFKISAYAFSTKSFWSRIVGKIKKMFNFL